MSEAQKRAKGRRGDIGFAISLRINKAVLGLW
jgi:hypothetical protein